MSRNSIGLIWLLCARSIHFFCAGSRFSLVSLALALWREAAAVVRADLWNREARGEERIGVGSGGCGWGSSVCAHPNTALIIWQAAPF